MPDMKFKTHMKVLLMMLVSALLFSSCFNIECVSDGKQTEIAVTPTASVASRVVGGLLQGAYPIEESMGIFACNSEFYDGQSWTSDARISNYFENEEFRYREDVQAWAGVTPYNWPSSGSLIFAGYSPFYQFGGSQTLDAGFDAETGTLLISGYQVEEYVPITNPQMYAADFEYKNSSQSDLMYFLPKTDSYGNYVGTMGVYAYNAKFYHALALVVLTVQAESDTDKEYIRLRKIAFSDMASKGDLSAKVGRTQMGDVTWTLSADGEFRTQTVLDNTDNSGMGINVSPRKVVEILTIPVGQHDINITYDLIVNGKPHQETVSFQTRWEAGQKYVYNLILGIDTIQLVPQITTDWAVNE